MRSGDLRFTFAEFDSAAARVAFLLDKAGIEPGDRVGVMLPNTPAFAIAFYGVMYRGAVAVPMNPLLKAREVAYYLSNSAAEALLRRLLPPPRRPCRAPGRRAFSAGSSMTPSWRT